MHITIYTDNLPAHAGGITKGPFIYIRPKYKDDRGLLEHEKMHVKQWWAVTLLAIMAIVAVGHLYVGLPLETALSYSPFGIAVYSIIYEFVPALRLKFEVQAYRKQISYYTDKEASARVLGKFLAEKYGLTITPEEATKLLLE